MAMGAQGWIRCCAIVGAVLLTAGCSSSGGVRDRLDQATGLAWAAAAEPSVYARADPSYSRAARDYVYIGPVETNARGFREYFLWVGIGTTLDRGFLAPAGDSVARITLLIDDEPVDLELMPWTELIGAATSIEPYDPAVRPLSELGARVTRDLIARVDAAMPGIVSVVGPAGESRRYYAWSLPSGWPRFAADGSGR